MVPQCGGGGGGGGGGCQCGGDHIVKDRKTVLERGRKEERKEAKRGRVNAKGRKKRKEMIWGPNHDWVVKDGRT